MTQIIRKPILRLTFDRTYERKGYALRSGQKLITQIQVCKGGGWRIIFNFLRVGKAEGWGPV